MPNLRLAVLLCDNIIVKSPDDGAEHVNYTQMYHQFLAESLAEITSEVTFTFDGYDVVNDMTYPSESAHYDGILISGSRACVNDDLPWVKTLLVYTKRIITEKPSLKVFGVCFGYQIICKAFGGAVEKMGGEVSVTRIGLTNLGKAIFRAPELHLQQCHQDQVTEHPLHAHLLGSSDDTHNQGIVMFDPTTAPPPADLDSDMPPAKMTSIQVLAVQAHPEFTDYIMRTILGYIAGALPQVVLDNAIARVGQPTDAISKVGRAMWEVLGVTSKY